MDAAVAGYKDAIENRRKEPLVVIPLAIVDFLCIHPFTDGNGAVRELAGRDGTDQYHDSHGAVQWLAWYRNRSFTLVVLTRQPDLVGSVTDATATVAWPGC